MGDLNDTNITDLNESDWTSLLMGPMHRLNLLERISRDHLSTKRKSYRRPKKLPRNITRIKRRRSQSR